MTAPELTVEVEKLNGEVGRIREDIKEQKQFEKDVREKVSHLGVFKSVAIGGVVLTLAGFCTLILTAVYKFGALEATVRHQTADIARLESAIKENTDSINKLRRYGEWVATGKVLGVAGDLITVQESDGSQHQFKADKDTKFFIGGKKATIEAIRPGMQLTFAVGPDHRLTRVEDVPPVPPPEEKPRKPFEPLPFLPPKPGKQDK